MHSYKNLAVIALAASAISPALAAPGPLAAQEIQNQARAELDDRGFGGGLWGLALSILPALFGSGSSGKSRRSGSDVTSDEFIKAIYGLSKRTDPGPSAEDLVAALKLFGRALNELD